MRTFRIFNLDEFRSMGKPGVLGKAIRKFNSLAHHHNDRKFKLPLRGLKIVKSSNVPVKIGKIPYA